MYLLKDYLKLDGTPLANASVDYKELLKFAQDNELITEDTTDNSLFKYDSTTDVLILPDYEDYNYLVRLRADNSSLVDLANNTWTTSSASIITDSELGKEVLSMDSSGYAETSTLLENISDTDDFTIYIKFKLDTLNEYPLFLSTIPNRTGVNYRTIHVNYSPYPTLQCVSILNESWLNSIQGTASMNPTTGVWHSIAITRQNGTAYLFFDGNILATQTNWNYSFDFAGHPLRVGKALYISSAETLIGSISEVDIVKGKAFWIDNFTPPTDYIDKPSSLKGETIPQIKYRTTTSIWDTVQIGKFVATAPAHYEREQLYTTNKTTITIYPTWININGMGYVLEGTKIIDIENADNWDDSQYVTASNRAGKDFYIYVTQPVSNDAPNFILSANSTVPTGYTADNSRKIGGFHCLCLSVGTISGHTLSDYLTGDILPQSPWDLKHRAISENEGMVYIPEVNKWVDIYLASWDGSKLVSQYNAVIADGASSPNFHGEKFVETFGLVNKQLPRRDDFVVFAKGSNEGTTILGSADPNTTGGHVDTNNRRMISNYGIEDCCGVMLQWVNDYSEAMSTSYTSGYYIMNNYNWVSNPVYNPNCDIQSYGSCFGLLRRIASGGAFNHGSYCGSRTTSMLAFSACLGTDFASRGSAETR